MDRGVITDEKLDDLLKNALQEKAECIDVSNKLKKKIDDEIESRLKKKVLNYSQVSGHKKSIKFFRSKFKHSAPSIIFLLRLE